METVPNYVKTLLIPKDPGGAEKCRCVFKPRVSSAVEIQLRIIKQIAYAVRITRTANRSGEHTDRVTLALARNKALFLSSYWICAHPNGISYALAFSWWAGFVVDVTREGSVGNSIRMGTYLLHINWL